MNYFIKQYTFLSILLLGFSFVGKAQIKTSDHNNTVRFTENKNQWEANILYRAQLDGGALFLEKNCFTYSFYDKEKLRETHHSASVKQEAGGDHHPSQKYTPFIRSHSFRMTFVGAKSTAELSSRNMTSDYNNYFIGSDSSKWAGNVKNYREVNYIDLYEGINLQVLGMQNSLKYNFIVKPGVNPNKIQLSYQGLLDLRIKKGDLYLKTLFNEIIDQKPYAYQIIENIKVEVPCKYVLDDSIVSFKFSKSYDSLYPLIIDPVLIFAASSGSFADNFGMTATYDADGNLYSGGTVFDQGYPTTLGAFDTTYNDIVQYGRSDVVITKYDSSGTSLLYSTYLGGPGGSEIVTSLVVNAQNELLLYGATGSPNFPITVNAYQSTFSGGTQLTFTPNGTYFFNGTDIYVSKLNSSGTSLLASTYIGGSANDGVNINNTAELVPPDGIWLGRQVVSEFNPAVLSNSVDFFRKVFNPSDGAWYGYVESKHDSLQYNYGDQYRGEINVDSYGNVCIASSTRSTDFPSDNGFDKTLNGTQDAVVFKFNGGLTSLLWSTYLGGDDNDAGYALAIDDSSNIYVTGGTRSKTGFYTSPGALQTVYNGGEADGYVTKIKADGSGILASTYWGTSNYDQSYFVQIDRDEDVYLVGQTEGLMPVDSTLYYNNNSGQFIVKMNEQLSMNIFSTVFGNNNGRPNISPSAFLVDVCENIYVSGWGGDIIKGLPTMGMPITPDAAQATTDGYNFYLFVLSPGADSLIYASYFGGNTSEEHVDGGTSRFDKRGIVYQSVCAGCGGNDDFPVTPGAWPYTSPDFTPFDPNNSDPTGINMNSNCNNGVFKFDFQIPLVFADIGIDIQSSGCIPYTTQFKNLSTSGAPHLWDFGGGDTTSVENPVRNYSVPGTYLVKLYAIDTSTCNYTDSTFIFVTVNPLPTAIPLGALDTTICGDETVGLKLQSATPATFTWIASDNPNVTGESTTIQTTDSITDFLHNSTSITQVVTYTIIPQSITGLCIGAPVTYTVNVLPLPVLTLGADTTICDATTLNVPLTSNIPSSYTWIANDNSNVLGESLLLKITDTINDFLQNTSTLMQVITYTVTPISNSGSCSGQPATYPVFIIPIPTLFNNSDTTVCSNTPLDIVFTSNVASAFTWLATDNPNLTGESTTPQIKDTLTDNLQNNTNVIQTVSYTVTPVSDQKNCPGQPFTITINVNPSPIITPIPDTLICEDVTLNIGFNTNIPSTYAWLASDNSMVTGESTSIQATDTIKDQLQNQSLSTQVVTYTITPTSILGGCTAASIQFNVDVLSSPMINNGLFKEICNNIQLNEPLTSSIPSTFTWIAEDNGNVSGETLSLQNSDTINDLLQNNTTTNQIVSYSVIPTSTSGNCLGPLTAISIEVVPSPVLQLNPDTTICNKQELGISFISNIPSSYTWIATDNLNVQGESLSIQTSDTLNDILQNNSAINQWVTYTIIPTSTMANCVGSTFTFSVNVNPELTADFNFIHNACVYEATFSDASINLPVKWNWDFGDGNTDTLQNPPTHTYDNPGIYNVTLTVMDNNNCQDTVIQPIDFSEPVISISQEKAICIGEQVQLNASGGVAYDWSPAISLDNSQISNPIATPTATTSYSVNVTTVTPLGDSCSKIVSTTITVTDPSTFSVAAKVDRDTIFRGQTTTIHAILSDTSQKVNWKASSKESLPSLKDVEVSPALTTTYTVSIQGDENCSKSAMVEVFVIACDPATVFVPNTFTPNGDGKNDILYVRGNEITDLYFAVYNRWGELVFETTDIKKGWDGIYKNMNSDPVVFAWYLRAKCYDGFEFKKQGNVTLLR